MAKNVQDAGGFFRPRCCRPLPSRARTPRIRSHSWRALRGIREAPSRHSRPWTSSPPTRPGCPAGARRLSVAVYHEDLEEGLARLEQPDAALALVPLPFYLEYVDRLDLLPILQAGSVVSPAGDLDPGDRQGNGRRSGRRWTDGRSLGGEAIPRPSSATSRSMAGALCPTRRR